MKVISYSAVIEMLVDEGYLKGEEFIANEKPTHGNCCTCQDCGQNHDDCVCEHNRLLGWIKKMPIFNIDV